MFSERLNDYAPSCLQYGGETNYGETARARVGPPKVAKADAIHEKYKGKSVSDGLASDIKCKLNSSVKGGYCSFPGFRNHVMYLAQKFPKTKGDPVNKTGMWSPSRIIYGYYRASLFGKNVTSRSSLSLNFTSFVLASAKTQRGWQPRAPSRCANFSVLALVVHRRSTIL